MEGLLTLKIGLPFDLARFPRQGRVGPVFVKHVINFVGMGRDFARGFSIMKE